MNLTKRMFSFLMAVLMLMSVLPISVGAESSAWMSDHEHIFAWDSPYVYVTETYHSIACSICSASGMEPHSFVDNVCTACGYQLHEHSYVRVDNKSTSHTLHVVRCEFCDKLKFEDHIYADGICTVCGFAAHEPNLIWEDSNTYSPWSHELTCTLCDIKEHEHHYLAYKNCGPCSVCPYVLCPHEGIYYKEGNKVDYDYHYLYCDTCDRTVDKEKHSYVDGVCTVCGFRECVVHDYVWKVDNNCHEGLHALTCSVCKRPKWEEHNWDVNNICSVCEMKHEGEKPDAPTSLSVSVTSDGVKVSWGAVENAIRYRVYYKTASDSWTYAGYTLDTSIEVTGLTSGTKYYFAVYTCDGDLLYSDRSASKSVTFIAAPNLPTVSETTKGVKVTWEAVKGAVNYRVMYKTASGSWKTAGTTTDTSYTVTGLTGGTEYYFTVRCVNADNSKTTSAYNTTGTPITLKKTYKITYDANGGSGAPSSQTKTYGKTLTLSSTVPTRKGYTFAGWATSASGDVKYQAGGSYTSNSAKTLYAKWTANKYTIKFNGNGKTGGSMSSMTSRKYGTSYTLTANAYTRTGYNFVGWNTKADGSGTSYSDGASVKNLSSKDGGSITLYAQWKLKTYKVTFNANGGKSAPSAQTKTYGKTLTLTTSKPTRSGYSFQGWATSATSTTVKYKAGASYTSNASKTLYAVWKKK